MMGPVQKLPRKRDTLKTGGAEILLSTPSRPYSTLGDLQHKRRSKAARLVAQPTPTRMLLRGIRVTPESIQAALGVPPHFTTKRSFR
eukprot:2341179-Amphidinium_carterae.1